MAGDWIKMRSDLFTHPKVVRITSALKADRLRTVGGLMSVWCLFDAHSIDGRLEGYKLETVDEMIGWSGFAAAMKTVGWLDEDSEGLVLPEFDTHNGQSAKRRAQDSDRKRAERLSASEADKTGTREEKRREEEKHMSACASDVLDYLNQKADRKFSPTPANTKLIIARVREGATVEDLKAVVDMKVAEWLDNPKMEQYLRPATLFNAEKFGQYSGSLGSVNGHSDNPFA